MKTVSTIRQAFIDYFAAKGHAPVASSSLVPGNDPTLLFTNAGMVPFKDVFLGTENRNYNKAVSSQRCVRAGGKHNDLENVGYTARHHTFFEMLGNFSFGDYFKEDAIRFAWEFLTVELNLPKEKLWVTTFEKDDEATDIWINTIGVDPSRVSRIGEKDNFWSMGATGPCGPCSEIFYDHGPDVAGGPPGTPEEDGDRYIEIWNLVFMQYNRNEDGDLIPLPKPSVDTGMGLERIAAVMQHVHSNYQIDLFVDLIEEVAKVTKTQDRTHVSLKVIADHIRSCAFLIADGVLPSNAGRGYVLRRIIRRALRHGYKLGVKDPFFHQLVNVLVKTMGEAYPELVQKQVAIEKALLKEEQRFAETLEKGMGLLNVALQNSTGKLSGQTVFKLYDTYGFPADLTADVAREHGLEVDMDAFESEMDKQREGSKEASQFSARHSLFADSTVESEFVGYTQSDSETSIIALVNEDGQLVDELTQGETGSVVLKQTPFYAESGGQVGDQGVISSDTSLFEVADTQKDADIHVHMGVCKKGGLSVGQQVHAKIDIDRRRRVAVHHSATHLMHVALRRILGDQVEQKGSLVTDDKLRFDFSHEAPMTHEEMLDVENQVNAEIRENLDTSSKVMSMDDAIDAGAMALFGEKYGEEVRVLSIGSSIELCGGTHVSRVGDIGVFKIVSESGVAAGVRRVEAVVGEAALDTWKQQNQQIARIAGLVKSDPMQLENKVSQLLDQNKQLQKELTQLKQKMTAASGSDLVDTAVDVNGIKVVAAAVQVSDAKSLRDMADQLRDKLQSAVVVLGAVNENKVSLIAAVTKSESTLYKAGELVSYLAQQVGGKGGGRPDMAQAGGSQPENLEKALATTLQWVKEKQV